MAIPMSSAPDQSDPWAWQAYQAQVDPSVFGWQKSQVDSNTIGQFQGALEAAGKWNPAWNDFLTWQAPTGDVGNAGMPNPYDTPDLSGFAGWQYGSARSTGYNNLNALFDPSGAMFDGNVSSAQHSMHAGDYATMAAVIGGGMLGGAALGASGIGAGLGAATTGAATTGAAEGALGAIAPGAAADTGALATTGQFAMPELGTLATPNAVAPAWQTAAMSGAGKGALLNGGLTAIKGGSAGDILKAGVTGAVLGGVGGGVAGATGNQVAGGLAQGALGAAVQGGGNVAQTGTTNAGDWTSAITPGLNFLGTALNANAQGTAAGQQIAGANNAAAIEAAQRAPYIAAGGNALGQLSAGLQQGGQFNKPFTMADAQNSDAMKVALQYGNEAVTNSAAAKSGLLNSNAVKQGQVTAADIATQYQQQAFNQNRAMNSDAMSGLTNLAGIGNTNNAAVADTGANAAALAGGVNASATLGQNNIWGKAITDTGNQQSIQGTLGKIFGNAVTGSNSTPAVPGSTDSYIAANADPNYAIDPLPQFSMGGA